MRCSKLGSGTPSSAGAFTSFSGFALFEFRRSGFALLEFRSSGFALALLRDRDSEEATDACRAELGEGLAGCFAVRWLFRSACVILDLFCSWIQAPEKREELGS